MTGSSLSPRAHPYGRRKSKAERDAEAIEAYNLKLGGARTDQIAAALGISVGSVVNRLESARKLVLTPPVEAYREQQAARLDGLLAGLLQTATSAKTGKSYITPDVVDAAVKIIDRQAKLHGLDMPTKIEQTTTILTASVEDETASLADELGLRREAKTA